MAIDLVSLIKQFLTPDMVQKLATTLGLDATQTQTAIGGAIPALLAGITGTAAQPGGAQKLADAANQQAGGLDGLAGMLGGTSQTALVETGSKLVGSLLGSNTQTALSSAISTFSGLGQGAVTALLGALAPVVLGVIGKQAGPQGFDANSLGALLTSQKDNIARAMPPRLSGLLDDSGVLEGLGNAANAATGSAKAAGASAKQYAGASAAAAATATRSAGRSWLTWLVPLVLVAGGLWFFLGRQQPDVPPTQQFTNKAVAPVTVSAPGLVIGDIDVSRTLTDSLGTLRTSLEGVTDAASAQTALPQLQNVTAEIDRVGAVVHNATIEQKTAVKGLLGPIVAQINPVIDKVLAIPGAEALKPTIDSIKAKLAGLST